jgi:hypothetical protein
MRKRYLILALAAIGSLCAHDDWSLNNHWNVTADFVYLKRNDLHGKEIVYNNNAPVLNTKKLLHSFDFEPGFRVALSYAKNHWSTIEATFMTLHHWEGAHVVRGSGSLSFPFNTPNYTTDYQTADKAKARYTSKFYNGELNYWRHFTARRADYFSFSGIIGARYMQLDEKFNLAFYKLSDVSHYKIHTWNHLYGLQLGLDLMVNPTPCISWEFLAKVGEALSRSKEHTFLGDNNDTTTLRRFGDHKSNGVFFADVEALITFQWTANFNLHAGYEVIYLNGMALAPEQIDKGTHAHSGRRIHDGGVIYIQGVVAGLNLGF